MIELDGYNVKERDIKNLPHNDEIKIRFLLGNIHGWSTKKFGSTPEYNSKLEKRIKASRVKSETHDCGDTCCPGIGETYYINSSKLKEIASSI